MKIKNVTFNRIVINLVISRSENCTVFGDLLIDAVVLCPHSITMAYYCQFRPQESSWAR